MFVVTVAIVTIVCQSSNAAPKWSRLQTTNFTFIGDASESDIRRTAHQLETFRDVLSQVVPGAAESASVPTVVIVFGNDRSFKPFKPRFQGKAIEVAGYFQSGQDVN